MHCGVNLALEDLLLRADKDPQALYLVFYENYPALVLGKSLEIEQEIWLHKKHPPVFRRISGGGSVAHLVGNLNYALFLSLEKFPEFMNVSLSYEKILTAVASGLGSRVSRQGYSDLAVTAGGVYRKFSGNAQCRKRGWIMHHGTLIYDKEAIRRIPYYLRPPPKEPDYRRGRGHGDFLAPVLPDYNKFSLMRRIRHGIAGYFGGELRILPPLQSGVKPFPPERLSR